MATPAEQIAKVLTGLQPEDIQVDPLGRVIIKSAAVREELRKLATDVTPDLVFTPRPDWTPGGGGTNLAQCFCTPKL